LLHKLLKLAGLLVICVQCNIIVSNFTYLRYSNFLPFIMPAETLIV